MLEIVRHEVAQKMRDWPLGVGLQEQAPKHFKLLWSKAMIVNVEEKIPLDGISCESERQAQSKIAGYLAELIASIKGIYRFKKSII